MADEAKFKILRKILAALGLSEEAIGDLIEWIQELLSGKGKDVKSLDQFPFKLRDDFLSPAERNFYLILKSVVASWAVVCPKVKLSDLFYATSRNMAERQSYANKIDRKHVDFLLCSLVDAMPVCGIELDDQSHNSSQRHARDVFVDGVFKAAGLPLVRVQVRSSYSAKELEKTFLQFAKTDQPSLSPGAREEKNNAEAPTCPKCGGVMILRTAKSGNNQGQQFWGCSNFPKCRGIVAHESS
jgi:hypothetical protein